MLASSAPGRQGSVLTLGPERMGMRRIFPNTNPLQEHTSKFPGFENRGGSGPLLKEPCGVCLNSHYMVVRWRGAGVTWAPRFTAGQRVHSRRSLAAMVWPEESGGLCLDWLPPPGLSSVALSLVTVPFLRGQRKNTGWF